MAVQRLDGGGVRDAGIVSGSSADRRFGQFARGRRPYLRQPARRGHQDHRSAATAEELFKLGPEKLYEIITHADALGDGARFIAQHMGPEMFDFSDITLTGPTETYEREMSLKVGDKDVALFNVGPAHTRGDTLVQVVQDRVVYTGDLLFLGVYPAIWNGSITGWMTACDHILDMDVDVVAA